MKIVDIPRFIRKKVEDGRYRIKLHALQRINERAALPSDIRESLLDCVLVEDYPDDKRGHSCLVWGKTKRGRDLHMVCGLTEDAIWVITIYEPDPARWESPLKRRIEG